MAKPSVSLCMIAKNEERFLEACLESAKGLVDEVVLVDTGSTDRTVEIAERFGARVLHAEWRDDFSAARNAALDGASGEWILHLDADEELVAEDVPLLRRLLSDSEASAFVLRILDPVSPQAGQAIRLWRSAPGVRYRGRVHEAPDLGDHAGEPGFVAHTGARIIHKGYDPKLVDTEAKRKRNIELLRLDLAERPDDFRGLFHLAQELAAEPEPEDEVITLYQRAFELDLRRSMPIIPFQLGLALERAERFDESLALLGRALQAYPRFADLELLRGRALFEMGDYHGALRSFETAHRMGDAPPDLPGVPGAGGPLALMMASWAEEALGNAAEAAALNGASVAAVRADPQLIRSLTWMERLDTPEEDVEKRIRAVADPNAPGMAETLEALFGRA